MIICSSLLLYTANYSHLDRERRIFEHQSLDIMSAHAPPSFTSHSVTSFPLHIRHVSSSSLSLSFTTCYATISLHFRSLHSLLPSSPLQLGKFFFCTKHISISLHTSSWEKVILKDDDALQTIYHSPLLTTLTTPIPPPSTHTHNATGYILTINSGLMDICAHLQHPTHLYQPPQRCKQTVARPSIGTHSPTSQSQTRLIWLCIRSSYHRSDLCCHWHCLYWYVHLHSSLISSESVLFYC